MIRVVIADDQELLRKSLGRIIGISDDIEVVGLAENGKEAVEICLELNPDVLMLDIEMPIMNGIEALELIKQRLPDIKVIILTTFDNTEYILEAFLQSADAYVSKEIAPDDIINTIKCVNNNLAVIDSSVKKLMIDRFKNAKKILASKTAVLDDLTEEENYIIKLIVDGKSNQSIASELKYSQGTIKNKIGKIYDKLGIDDRLQLAVYAVEHGL